jgi:co-chaperonin GroES (HSP10)
MKLKPVQDTVLVKLDPFEETFESDFNGSVIIRPEEVKEKPKTGTVKAIGPGRTYAKGYVPTTLNKGDRVLVDWATGHDMTQGNSGRLFVWVQETEILGVIE